MSKAKLILCVLCVCVLAGCAPASYATPSPSELRRQAKVAEAQAEALRGLAVETEQHEAAVQATQRAAAQQAAQTATAQAVEAAQQRATQTATAREAAQTATAIALPTATLLPTATATATPRPTATDAPTQAAIVLPDTPQLASNTTASRAGGWPPALQCVAVGGFVVVALLACYWLLRPAFR